MTYRFRSFEIRDDMVAGIRRYVDEFITPGSFLQAIIENDLKTAIEQADEENLRNIPAFVSYFYNETPRECWGSREKMLAWLQKRWEIK